MADKIGNAYTRTSNINMWQQWPPKGKLQISSEFLHQLSKREEHGQKEIYDPSVLQTGESDNTHNCTQTFLHRRISSRYSLYFSTTSGLPQWSNKSSRTKW